MYCSFCYFLTSILLVFYAKKAQYIHMNIVIWCLTAFITALLAYKVEYPIKRLSFGFLLTQSFVGAFVVGTIAHVVLGLGSLLEFSFISAHLAWTGALVGIYLIKRDIYLQPRIKNILQIQWRSVVNRSYRRLSNALQL